MSFERYVAELEGLRARHGHHGPTNLVALSSTVSTNLLARAIALDYESGGIDLLSPILILAWEQSGGRGRLGRSWSSPAGRGVYATLLQPLGDPRQLQSLPLLVGVGLCRALAPHLPRPCRLKWPNDLLAESAAPGAGVEGGGRAARWRKIGGILIEALVRPGEPVAALIGFGVNHSHRREELPGNATSVAGEGGDGAGIAQLTWELVEGVERELAHLGNAAYAINCYRALSIHQPGEAMTFQRGEETLEGVFLGFDEHGLLRLGQPERELLLAAGEVIGP